MVKKSVVFVIFFVTGLYLFATAQEPDILIYNGTKYNIIVNPMESYFNEFPEKRPQSTARSTSLWRGYTATFEIIKNELWVVDIKILEFEIINGRHTSRYVSVINDVLDGNNRMKIDWFNGLLVLPHGSLVEYVHMGYASTYEYYKILEIQNGNFMRELNINDKQYVIFRERQFELYKQTDAYKRLLREENITTEEEKEFEYFLRIFITEYLEMIYE